MAPPNLSSNDPTVQTPEGQKQFIHSYLNDNDVYPSFEAETKLNKADLSPQAQARLTELRENGYVILRNVLDANQVQRVKNALAAVGHKMYGRNRFEGTKTVRVNGLVGKHVVFSGMAEHPEIMELVDGILLPNFQMTLMQSIQIFPGEVRQPLHYDDGPLRIRSEEYSPLTVATIWAISPFTETNGSTVLFPNSHKWPSTRLPDLEKDHWIKAIMNPGDVIIYLGTVWHAGGANTDTPGTDERIGLTIQYTQPFLRPNENQFLAVHPRDVLKMSGRMQTLLGYGMHSPNYGNANGRHPLRQLTAENGGTMKWFEQVDDGEGPLIKNKDKDKSKL